MEECRCDPAIGRVLRLMTKKEEREAKKLEKLRLEKERMYEMFSFEREYGDHQAICGIDEVGRGPLAGPVPQFHGEESPPRQPARLYQDAVSADR